MPSQLTGPFWISIAIIIVGIILFIFPPKFGNSFFGPKLKSVLKDEKTWKAGQTLNALLYIVLGSAALAYIILDTGNHALIMLLMMIGLYKAGVLLIDKFIQKKYPTQKESTGL